MRSYQSVPIEADSARGARGARGAASTSTSAVVDVAQDFAHDDAEFNDGPLSSWWRRGGSSRGALLGALLVTLTLLVFVVLGASPRNTASLSSTNLIEQEQPSSSMLAEKSSSLENAEFEFAGHYSAASKTTEHHSSHESSHHKAHRGHSERDSNKVSIVDSEESEQVDEAVYIGSSPSQGASEEDEENEASTTKSPASSSSSSSSSSSPKKTKHHHAQKPHEKKEHTKSHEKSHDKSHEKPVSSPKKSHEKPAPSPKKSHEKPAASSDDANTAAAAPATPEDDPSLNRAPQEPTQAEPAQAEPAAAEPAAADEPAATAEPTAKPSSHGNKAPSHPTVHPASSVTLATPPSAELAHDEDSSPLTSQACEPPYPGYPFCESKVAELQNMWKKDAATEQYYRARGIDGSKCSFLTYLNLNGFFCPEANDWNRQKIRGVNLGGWLVLEPWIRPSLFLQFSEADKVVDHWNFCERLGKAECKRQMEKHWDEWLTLDDLRALAQADINHVRIPVGYWLFGDIQEGEPWVTGELFYLERAIRWCSEVGLHVILDLHCAPGSQNGFDNSGRAGSIHFADSVQESSGRLTYPNIDRALRVIDRMASHFTAAEYNGAVAGIELVNEAFITIPIEIVKDYYLQGYELVKKYADIAVVIGDSFRFGAWNDFMFPPHYRHVWIDTHIYQVFDMYRLSFTWQQHLDQTCKQNKPEVSVAPLSTMVGEWALATNDCARWLNGYQVGARFDGTYSLTHPWEHAAPLGSCIGYNDVRNTTVWTPEYRQFLREFAEKQMDAYESGSSAGWFFWNFKTEDAPQWNYLMGVREGWIPSDHSKRIYRCEL